MKIQQLRDEGVGQYGMRNGRTLCWDGESMLGVLIQDNFSGMDSLEGGMYRPYLYHLTPDLVKSAILAWNSYDDCRGSGWLCWWHDNCEQLCESERYYGAPEEALGKYMARIALATPKPRYDFDPAGVCE